MRTSLNDLMPSPNDIVVRFIEAPIMFSPTSITLLGIIKDFKPVSLHFQSLLLVLEWLFLEVINNL